MIKHRYLKYMGIVSVKSFSFALKVIKTYKFLIDNKREFVLSKQLLRSGTSIGALIKEAEHAQSKADFLHKMNIALKEANETEYWIMLLKDSNFISNEQYDQIIFECREILHLLIRIVSTTKLSLKR
jgi:four helix bundle protein